MFGAMHFLRGAKAFSPIKPRTALRRLGPGVRHPTAFIGSERVSAQFLTSSARDGYRGYRDIPFVKAELSAGNVTAIQINFPKNDRVPVIYFDVGRLPIQQGEFEQHWVKETASEDGAQVMELFVNIRSVWVACGWRSYRAFHRSMVKEWTKLKDLPVADLKRVTND